jgi:hypothetical protein
VNVAKYGPIAIADITVDLMREVAQRHSSLDLARRTRVRVRRPPADGPPVWFYRLWRSPCTPEQIAQARGIELRDMFVGKLASGEVATVVSTLHERDCSWQHYHPWILLSCSSGVSGWFFELDALEILSAARAGDEVHE